MRWEGHLECMGDKRKLTEFWLENFKKVNHLEEQGVSGMILLKWNIK
jgi:hypothetical protein